MSEVKTSINMSIKKARSSQHTAVSQQDYSPGVHKSKNNNVELNKSPEQS